jgi:hypothetical protein
MMTLLADLVDRLKQRLMLRDQKPSAVPPDIDVRIRSFTREGFTIRMFAGIDDPTSQDSAIPINADYRVFDLCLHVSIAARLRFCDKLQQISLASTLAFE